jgi:hypothetical protein
MAGGLGHGKRWTINGGRSSDAKTDVPWVTGDMELWIGD